MLSNPTHRTQQQPLLLLVLLHRLHLPLHSLICLHLLHPLPLRLQNLIPHPSLPPPPPLFQRSHHQGPNTPRRNPLQVLRRHGLSSYFYCHLSKSFISKAFTSPPSTSLNTASPTTPLKSPLGVDFVSERAELVRSLTLINKVLYTKEGFSPLGSGGACGERGCVGDFLLFLRLTEGDLLGFFCFCD